MYSIRQKEETANIRKYKQNSKPEGVLEAEIG